MGPKMIVAVLQMRESNLGLLEEFMKLLRAGSGR